MNKYTWIWFWRNTVVPETKGILWVVMIVAALTCLTADAQEEDEWWADDPVQQHPTEPAEPDKLWELTLVQGEALIDIPHRFTTRSLCVGLGIKYVHTDLSLKGFICEEEEVEPT
tara:strand:- start:534 stop:878 length:345 start_codon:yes stop_codon:yes gene_type:complete